MSRSRSALEEKVDCGICDGKHTDWSSRRALNKVALEFEVVVHDDVAHNDFDLLDREKPSRAALWTVAESNVIWTGRARLSKTVDAH